MVLTKNRYSGLIYRHLNLNGYNFAWVNLDPYKHDIILDEIPLFEHLVGNEPREAEA